MSIFRLYLFILLFFSVQDSKARKRKASITHPTTLAGLVTKNAQRSTTAAVVVNLENLKTVYAFNQKTPLIPASNTKLFTAGAAFHILGPSFRYETAFYTEDPQRGKSIRNLYIKGVGDPTLLSKDLDQMVQKLKAQGIRDIKGTIIVDTSIFDDQSTGPGWAPGDGPIFDKSKVTGFLVDHSCISVRIKPAHAPGRKPLVSLDPLNTFLTVDNRALTVSHATKEPIHTFITQDNRILVKGKIALKDKKKFYRIALQNPALFAGHVVRALLKKHTISHRGAVLQGTLPAKAQMLVRHFSEPVADIVKDMMKKSDNLYADALFKTIGARRSGVPGTWAKGKKAIEEFLVQTLKLPKQSFACNDGSGLSRLNRASASFISDFLIAFYKKSPFKNLFIDSLPIAGTDGTLRNRMTGSTIKGTVKAKTGSLAGVSSLSGYIFPPGGGCFAFALLTNRHKGAAFSAKHAFEDPFCTLIARRTIG